MLTAISTGKKKEIPKLFSILTNFSFLIILYGNLFFWGKTGMKFNDDLQMFRYDNLKVEFDP